MPTLVGLPADALTTESLAHRLRRGRMPWFEAARIARAICSAVAEARTAGMHHGQLAPKNIGLERGPHGDERAIIFGFTPPTNAHDTDDDTTYSGDAIADIAYFSPQQLAGCLPDERSKIYSIGVMTFEMLAGHRPFPHASTAPALFAAMMAHVPSPLHDEIPHAFELVVLQCLEREPAARFGSLRELVAVLDRVLAARPASASTAAQPPRISYPARAFFVLPLQPQHVAALPAFDVQIRGTGVVRLDRATIAQTTSGSALAIALAAALVMFAIGALVWIRC